MKKLVTVTRPECRRLCIRASSAAFWGLEAAGLRQRAWSAGQVFLQQPSLCGSSVKSWAEVRSLAKDQVTQSRLHQPCSISPSDRGHNIHLPAKGLAAVAQSLQVAEAQERKGPGGQLVTDGRVKYVAAGHWVPPLHAGALALPRPTIISAGAGIAHAREPRLQAQLSYTCRACSCRRRPEVWPAISATRDRALSGSLLKAISAVKKKKKKKKAKDVTDWGMSHGNPHKDHVL